MLATIIIHCDKLKRSHTHRQNKKCISYNILHNCMVYATRSVAVRETTRRWWTEQNQRSEEKDCFSIAVVAMGDDLIVSWVSVYFKLWTAVVAYCICMDGVFRRYVWNWFIHSRSTTYKINNANTLLPVCLFCFGRCGLL